ncbi:MAG: putative glycoside hydrolase [Eubacteriales bacterium]
MAIRRTGYTGRKRRLRRRLTVLAVFLLLFAGLAAFSVVGNNLLKKVEGEDGPTTPIQTISAPDFIPPTSDEQNPTSGGSEGEPSVPEKYNGEQLELLSLTGYDQLTEKIEDYKSRGINAVYITLKDTAGKLSYSSAVPEAQSAGALPSSPAVSLDEAVKQLHQSGIYVTGGICAFRDDLAAQRFPEMALMHVEGVRWMDGESRWLTAYSGKSRGYIISLAAEAVSLGVDEIVLTHFYLPNTSNTSVIAYNDGGIDKTTTVTAFIKQLRGELDKVSAGVKLGLQLTPRIISSDPSAVTGVDSAALLQTADFLSLPFIPSELPDGLNINGVSFKNAAADRTGSVKALAGALSDRLDTGRLRPVLKREADMSEEDLNAQKQALFEYGCENWLVWN